MKKVTYLVCCVGLALQSCQSGQVKNENPFFNTYETPHEVPPFHLIKNQHYLPAYEEGMKQHQAEIDAIINNPEAPTFKNTIDALETSGELLNNGCPNWESAASFVPPFYIYKLILAVKLN